MEVVCEPKVVKDIIAIAVGFGVEAKVVGHVERSPGRSLTICIAGQCYEFDAADN
jgi:hypothetical protein